MFKRLVRFLISILGSSSQETKPYWNQRAEKYGKRAVLNLNHKEESYEQITTEQKAQLLPLLKNKLRGDEKLVLDLGCGPGRFTESLADLINGKAIGVDPVAKFLSLAPKSSNVEYRLMEGAKILAEDRSIDIVWICLVLGGIPDKELQQYVDEIKRVLIPKGLVFIVENIAEKEPTDYWHYRSISFYKKLFPFIHTKQIYSYKDLGEEIAVISGRAHE